MIDVLKPLIQQFMPFAQQQMGFSRPPRLFLRQDSENSANPLGKTGFYDPTNESITLYVTGRHPKDIMRSLAHELMHHTQKCNGDFDGVENMGEQGYAQSNSHLRTMEIQAYQASIVFRDWEDSIKGTIYNESLQKGAKENMSTKNWKNSELKTLLSEKWGFKMDLGQLNERKADDWGKNPAAFTGTEEEEEEEVEDVKKGKALEENELFEQATTICKQRHELLGDKAVRGCIEEEMGRLMEKFTDPRIGGADFTPEPESALADRDEKNLGFDWHWRTDACKKAKEALDTAITDSERRVAANPDLSNQATPDRVIAKLRAKYDEKCTKLETNPRTRRVPGIFPPYPEWINEGCPHEEEEEAEVELYEEEPTPPPAVKVAVSEERIREMAKAAIKHFRANGKG